MPPRHARRRRRRPQVNVRPLAWAIVILGVASSLAANVAAAQPSPVGWAVAAWAPVAMTASFALLEFEPSDGTWLDRGRTAVVLAVGLMAAWVSYWHIVSLALSVGEEKVSAFLYPVLIDGMILVGTLTLAKVNPTARDPRRPAATSDSVRRGRDRDRGAAVLVPVSSDGGRSGLNGSAVVPPTGPPASPDRTKTSKAEREERMAAFLDEHPDATREQVAEALGIGIRSVAPDRSEVWAAHIANQEPEPEPATSLLDGVLS